MGKSIEELLGEYQKIDRKERVVKRSKATKPHPYFTQLYPRGIFAQRVLDVTSRPCATPRKHKTCIPAPNKLSDKLSDKVNDQTATEMANQLCVICYCRLTDATSDVPKEIESTECQHHFHKDCLKTWKRMSSTCPVCRKVMFNLN